MPNGNFNDGKMVISIASAPYLVGYTFAEPDPANKIKIKYWIRILL